jgi:two-component system, cell cycle sensor histidine kinase and response regulator CckA
LRALVIEDSPTSRRQLVDALERRGHRALCVSDGEAGLRLHEQTPFDLVVAAWAPADPGAPDLCRRVRAVPRGEQIPILAVIDGDDGAGVAAAFEAGASDCVHRPLDPVQLEARVRVAERQVREAGSTIRHRADLGSAEDALRQSEAAFKRLTENSPEAIMVHRGGRFLYVNPTFVRFLGYEAPDQLMTRKLLDVVHPDDRALVLRDHGSIQETGGPTAPVEVRLECRDGRLATVQALGMRITYEGRDAVLVMCRDVTERNEMQARLMLADRMASVGTLAAGVAHELNNPLAYVLSNVRLLREELDSSGDGVSPDRAFDLQELVDEAVHGIERMRSIVRDLKTFSRMDDEHLEVVEVGSVVRACLNLCRNELRHRAIVDVELTPTPSVRINESRLAQMVLNLLINAAQALPEGTAELGRITVRTRAEGDLTVLEVEDTGHGIAAGATARIFDPFFTTKGPGEGTGLGLSICRNIATAAGGGIDVESVEGEGSRFRVWLPQDRGRRPERSISPRPPSGPPGAVSRLLVIDDEPLVARSLKRVLRDHDVTLASTGEQAVDLLTSNGSHFDLVLCDLMMPGMTGMDVFGAVTDKMPELADRFVFMTGGAFTSGARDFLDHVANERIEKPFDPNRLRTLVRERTQG